MRSLFALCIAAAAWPVSVAGQTDPGNIEVPIEIEPAIEATEAAPEEVLVTGEFPGPGMWKVTRADDPDQHVLWILGLPPPLPKKMKWKSTEVETVIRSSQEILLPGTIDAEPDERIGFFKAVSLVPAALGARKNPEKGTLQDALTPELYARWLALKKRFLGRDTGVERWRPIFAANKLREEAVDDLKLGSNSMVSDAVEKIGKKHKVPTTTPTLQFKFSSKDIRAKIKAFAREPLADTECFDATLSYVEAIADSDTMTQRATAWATGDVDTLVTLPKLPNAMLPCITAVMASQVAQDLVPQDIFAQVQKVWLDAAEKSLATNASTFAYLSLGDLTSDTGQLASLRAKGYLIEDPKRD
jgi:hypothetical protein